MLHIHIILKVLFNRNLSYFKLHSFIHTLLLLISLSLCFCVTVALKSGAVFAQQLSKK